MKFDCIGFGSINIDEFWEAPEAFFKVIGVYPGDEAIRDVEWFSHYYPILERKGSLKAIGPGGSAANAIAALHRMGFTTGFFGAAGNDVDRIIDIQELGQKDLLNIRRLDMPSGRCLALINSQDPNRDRALIIVPNANQFVDLEVSDYQYFFESSWVHMTSFVDPNPLEAQKRLTRALPNSVRISFDPGVVYCSLGLKELEPIITRSDALFVTREELAMITGCNNPNESAALLMEKGAKTVVMKMGPKGIMAFESNFQWSQKPIVPARLVDRTGAGDVAAAGFIAGRILGLSINDCLELSAEAASYSIQDYGRASYPNRKFLKNFLANRKKND